MRKHYNPDDPNLHICPKCKGMKKDPFSLDGEKVFSPKWKTLVKGEKWQCRNCGFVKELTVNG